MSDTRLRQYVLLPRRGLRADAEAARALMDIQQSGRSAMLGQTFDVRVLDSVQENGPKLIEISQAAADALNDPRNLVRAVPVVEYPRPGLRPSLQAPEARLAASAPPLAAPVAIIITCVDAQGGQSVAGADVIAFTNFAARQGAKGRTDAQGQIQLALGGGTIDRLYIYAPPNYWGGYRQSIPAANLTILLEPVNLGFVDAVRHYYPGSQFKLETGVKVGILDTGCGPHNDLSFAGGAATVTGEPPHDWTDHDIHGSHVAGLIGASGGLNGIAPGVVMYAYRVFPAQGGATNYAILKALILAAHDGCDIVNLSLGGGPFDEIVEEAIADACNQGMLAVIAAGNGGRGAVSYPAAHQGAIAVSAFGREQSFPVDSLETGDILRPPVSPNDPLAFLAAFSNVGQKIAVTGPGVGVLSTLPQNQYGPLSGTSMAAPVVAGAAASLLSRDLAIFNMARDRARSDAIRNLLLQNCVRLGFGGTFEGYGMPDPQVV